MEIIISSQFTIRIETAMGTKNSTDKKKDEKVRTEF